MKRSVLTPRGGQLKPPPVEMTVQSDLEEQTWEVWRPGQGKRRLDGRTRSILSAAAVAAIVVNAGAAWAYWKVTASETGGARAGTAVELTLPGRSNLNRPLTAGGMILEGFTAP